MKRIVISQPMYFPWLGHLNQAYFADEYVFYSDIQFARGFINRVQLLINNKQEFITVPFKGSKRNKINCIEIDNQQNWNEKHLTKLNYSFMGAKNKDFVLDFVKNIFNKNQIFLSELCKSSVMELCRKIFPDNCPVFYDSSEFKRESKSSQSLVDICLARRATHYLTGHGAKNYLDFELFSKNNIQVEFIDYQIKEYIQSNNKYITPYVSSLDAIARLELDQVNDLFLSNLMTSEIFMKSIK